MKIVINGIHANLRFSAAHMIPEHESCGCIHGHSYIIDVQVEGERSGKFGFVADFKEVKGVVRDISSTLDHKVLIPLQNNLINFKSTESSVEFVIQGKEYKLPEEDCLLLDLKSTSAEDLAEYFAEKVFDKLKEKGAKISSVEICINEGIGQGAFFTKSD
ncbi:MAG: 6-carboxytetrahydropterin synthase [Methanobacteriaceae archaeon]|nr:6-carboxytetrahydropterin synthase [Methanobacteriaceae archaeon]MDP2836706.1 6-carboxytetrahydropterin synthase [Methanobacteriaceae archaeon]MDP3485030.1 6-carboxytetrahydropterin synthase [Methanobacteriaceae archaeon]MDP3623614.1 6-carboxytetrahydropterin synthase [Methanobacteriaceae archaeon]